MATIAHRRRYGRYESGTTRGFLLKGWSPARSEEPMSIVVATTHEVHATASGSNAKFFVVQTIFALIYCDRPTFLPHTSVSQCL